MAHEADDPHLGRWLLQGLQPWSLDKAVSLRYGAEYSRWHRG